MTTSYFVHEETEESSLVEFVDSETGFSHKKTINTFGLSLEQKYERYQNHENAFIHRIGIGFFKPELPQEPL